VPGGRDAQTCPGGARGGKTPAHLTNFEPIIGEIASLTTAFARPVLLFNGDSHLC